MTRAPLWILADLHLAPEATEQLVTFEGLMRRAPAMVGGIVILGDLFDVWLADLESEFQARVLAQLQRLRRSGVELAYVEGNRDYWVARTRGSLFDVCAAQHLTFSLAGRVLHLAHGDLVNTADRPYRIWRWATHRRWLQRCLLALPAASAARLAERMERALRRTNLSHKARFPEAACRAYARPWLRGGCDAVVLGHFHQQHVLAQAGGALYVLGSWGMDYRGLELSAAGELAFTTLTA
jgi:UDP-2,3-diacylglucosamine hydrolase